MLARVPAVGGFKVLGPCVVSSRVGEGGTGVIYAGWHAALDLPVAVKCLRPSLAEDEEYVRRFHQEARITAKVEHPNLVRVYQVGVEANVHYLIMDYVAGESARQRVERQGPFPAADAVAVLFKATRGLAAAHRKGIVHRDIKPGNILIAGDGRVKLADLGLAKAFGGSGGPHTRPQIVFGTPAYMPPEQWESMAAVGPPADVYALGATLYFLLAGEDAYAGATPADIMRRVYTEPFPALPATVTPVPEGLVEILDRATRKEARERYAGARELLEAMYPLYLGMRGGSRLADPEAQSTLDSSNGPRPPPQELLARVRARVGPSGRRGSPPRSEPAARREPAAAKERSVLWLATGSVIAATGVVTLLAGILYALGGAPKEAIRLRAEVSQLEGRLLRREADLSERQRVRETRAKERRDLEAENNDRAREVEATGTWAERAGEIDNEIKEAMARRSTLLEKIRRVWAEIPAGERLLKDCLQRAPELTASVFGVVPGTGLITGGSGLLLADDWKPGAEYLATDPRVVVITFGETVRLAERFPPLFVGVVAQGFEGRVRIQAREVYRDPETNLAFLKLEPQGHGVPVVRCLNLRHLPEEAQDGAVFAVIDAEVLRGTIGSRTKAVDGATTFDLSLPTRPLFLGAPVFHDPEQGDPRCDLVGVVTSATPRNTMGVTPSGEVRAAVRRLRQGGPR